MATPQDKKASIQVADGSSILYQNGTDQPLTAAYYKPKPVTFKDSISHPINVSWIIPPWISALLQEDMSVPNRMLLVPFAQREAEVMQQMEVAEDAVARAKRTYPNWRPRGNLGLSSCPGKKVRLDGPVNGRAKIVRDLDMDFNRLHQLGFTRVVCCLFDEELELLGSPFPNYLEAANRHGVDVVRIPMVEGSTPYSFAEMDRVLDRMDETAKRGQNVLAHCRGGVGRAAVVACCWLLRLRYFKDHREVIDWVRAQRSPKAIETREQAQFVAGFQLWTQGGEDRAYSKAYETEIQRRINFSEANMAKAREDAASKNSRGHCADSPRQRHAQLHQQQHQHQVQHQQQQNHSHSSHQDLVRASSQSSQSSISSTAAVSSRRSTPISPALPLEQAQSHSRNHSTTNGSSATHR
ncbi:phosphatases II [Linnemannia elongata AG-77]|uniref:Phosphatases II n=1 Tax=Linnemannia elongata AG-77 TaxID=1314771 RepID=A0A197K4U8_9FUNG|nr:phosphatases II [Linnemannia elongata AG-77]